MRRTIKFIPFLIMALVIAVSAPAMADDLQDAKRAYGAGEFLEAAALLRPLAREGNVDALYLLGRMFEQGDGVKKDLNEARQYFDQAAKKGHQDAGQRLALYENADSGDESVVLEWYLPAAQEGDIEAQYNLGYMYETGWGVRVNDAEAVKWYREAAELQHDMAQLRLGMMYIVGQGVTQDDRKGVELLRMAAENGNRVAEVLVQELYDSGAAETLNAVRIISGLRRVVDDGEQETLRVLNASLDTARNRQQGSRRSVAKKLPSSSSEKTVESREVVEPVKDSSPNVSAAQLNLAKMLEQDRGSKAGSGDALKLYLSSARQGNADAQFKLGILYMQGKDVSRDVQEGLRWFRAASGQGHESANDYLQLWSNKLDSTNFGGTIAVTWLKEMARNWDTDALYSLGYIFETGRGVQVNSSEAKIWYRLAADGGHGNAAKRLDMMAQGVKPEALATTGSSSPAPDRTGKAVMQVDWTLIMLIAAGIGAVVMFVLFKRGALAGLLSEPALEGVSLENASASSQVAQDDMDFLKGLWDEKPDSSPPKVEPAKAVASPRQVEPEKPDIEKASAPIISEDDIQLPDLSSMIIRKEPANRPESNVAPVVTPPRQPLAAAAQRPPVAMPGPRKASIAADDIFRVGISRDELAAGRINADSLFDEGLAIDRAGKVLPKVKAEPEPTMDRPSQEGDSGFEFGTIDLNSLRKEKQQRQPQVKPPAAPVAPKPVVEERKLDVTAPFTDDEERSLAEVHFNIGIMFANGDGVPRNDVMAARWFLKAAEEGLPEAQFNIGEMYISGTGIEKNNALGMQWVQKASENGFKPAREYLAKRNQA